MEDNLAALRVLSEELKQQGDAVASSQRYLNLAKDRYRLGIDSYLNVITAQTTLLGNQRTELNLQVEQMTAERAIDRRPGRRLEWFVGGHFRGAVKAARVGIGKSKFCSTDQSRCIFLKSARQDRAGQSLCLMGPDGWSARFVSFATVVAAPLVAAVW